MMVCNRCPNLSFKPFSENKEKINFQKIILKKYPFSDFIVNYSGMGKKSAVLNHICDCELLLLLLF